MSEDKLISVSVVIRQSGLSNVEIAAITGIDQNVISRWRNEVKVPTERSLSRLSDALEFDPETILTLEKSRRVQFSKERKENFLHCDQSKKRNKGLDYVSRVTGIPERHIRNMMED